ncbi:MAG: hypothetical protein WC877_01190 [Dehalococcoidales bacterium]|jgi:hypothetical protein
MTKKKLSTITDQLNTDKLILELTDSQAYVVRDALELYSRIRTGHFEHIWSELAWDSEKNGGTNGVPDSQMWHHICNLLTRFWFPNLSPMASNWGVGHDTKSDRSWVIMEVVRHYLVWKYYPVDKDHPENHEIVDHGTPMNWLSNEPMPLIKKKE